MFVLIVSGRERIERREIAAMTSTLRGGNRPATDWTDEAGRAAAGATVRGSLPEDVYCRLPIVTDEHVFVGQARIDNRAELLEQLGVPCELRGQQSDCDVVHLAFRKWGERCLDHLAGDYAFAILRRADNRVFASVGHGNLVRLFYSLVDGRLILSPQLAGVLAHPFASKQLDLNALGLMIAPRIRPGSTAYASIHSLLSGHALIYENGVLDVKRWWMPDTSARHRYRNPADYVLQARELFGRAVKARLRSTAPIATTLSGGLDSTLVTATAAAQSALEGKALTAYTSVPEPGLTCSVRPGWENDDSSYAAAVAARYPDLRHVLVTPGGKCPLDIMPDIHRHSFTPVRNTANHLWLGRISTMAAESGSNVLLMGEMGNVTLSASGEGLFREHLWHLRLLGAARLIADQVRLGEIRSWKDLARQLLGPDGISWLRPLFGTNKETEPPGMAVLSRSSAGVAASQTAQMSAKGGFRANREFALLPRSSAWTADPIVQWNVERRDPTGDRALMEWLLSLPLDAIAIEGRPRGLARAMGENLLPDEVRFRRTSGAQVPEAPAIIRTHGDHYREVLEHVSGSKAYREIVDVDRLRQALEKIRSGSNDLSLSHTIDRALDVGLFVANHS